MDRKLNKVEKEAKKRLYKRQLKWIKEHPLTEEDLKGLSEEGNDDLIESSRRLLAESDKDKQR